MEFRINIKTLIFARNEAIIKSICKILATLGEDIKMVGATTVFDSFKDLIITHSPDLVFMDADLAIESDFQFINEEFRNFEIVFVSEASSFSIETFKYSALYCICTPFSHSQFEIAISRFKIKKRFSCAFKELQGLFERKKINTFRIMLPDGYGFRMVNVNDIIRCEAYGSYTDFYLNNKKRVVVSRPLSSFVNLLPSQIFCRVHNKHLVNLHYIKQYIRGRGGQIILLDGSSIDVSDRKKKDFLKQLKKIASIIPE
jgi:two-component system LytT family response regulator